MQPEKKSRRWLVLILLIPVCFITAIGVAVYTTGRNPLLPGNRAVTSDGATFQVDLLSPGMAENFSVGQPIDVFAQAWGLAPVDTVQLIVDGQVVDEMNDDAVAKPLAINFVWTGDTPGVHTLMVQATDLQGQTRQSQIVLINLNSPPLGESTASGGESLASFSQANGAAVDEVVALNPSLDPNAPLYPGQPVILPPRNGGSESSNGSDGSADPAGSSPLNNPRVASDPSLAGLSALIQWTVNFNDPVDNSYCYQTGDAVNWQRNPAGVFNFIPGQQWLQPILQNAQQSNTLIVLDCWGWKAGILKYLGQGQTILEAGTNPGPIHMNAGGFTAVGVPLISPQAYSLPAPRVPAPYALRAPSSIAECTSYHGSPLAEIACTEWMSAPVQSYHMLIWDWQPGTCLPGGGYCEWINDIRGFEVYIVDTQGTPIDFLQTIGVGQQMTAIPLPWGAVCYGVRAYSGNPLAGDPLRYSEMAVHCPSDPAQPQTVTIDMDEWFSGEGYTFFDIDCPFDGKGDGVVIIYGGVAENYGYPQKNMYPQGSQILVGDQWMHLDNGCDEHRNAKAIVHFPLNQIPPKAVVQRATLQFVHQGNSHSFSYPSTASNAKPVCATRLYTNEGPWEKPPGHFVNYLDGGPPGMDETYFWKNQFAQVIQDAPYQTIGSTTNQLDVTGTVLYWLNNPSSNFGFSFQSWTVDLEYTGIIHPDSHKSGISFCWSTLNEIQLVVEYYAP